MRTACVTIRDHRGRAYVYVTMASTVFEAAANAIEWFAAQFWKGPKPRRDTVYEVSLVSDSRRWWVPAEKVERWLTRRT